MGSSYKHLFKLYDLIQSGDVSSVEHFITNSTVQLNDILPCKGIGLLHLAVGIEPIEKSIECTEIILKNGGDPNLCNDDGVTPVHIAAIWGRVENLKLLIGCGGDPSRKDLDGLSAFDYAVREQQWNVFDYLHNVVDQINDSLGSPVAYSLDLERILLTTDQLVAEYEPGTDNQPLNGIATCRKSDMVRDWCEKSSLVMNKLYPTILGETFVVDDGPAAWQSINLTNNMTLDLTTDVNSNKSNLNETCNTFKTCLSKRTPVEISGIQRLQITSDESKVQTENSNDNLKQRFSVYENFSLPGSPNSIIHMNYNSKSSLRKNQSKDTSSSELKRLNFNSSQSLLTDDSQEFDKVLAVAQNKTNEWISNRSSDCQITDIRACNTRRSSASSGVSSNFSGGSIVLANVQEEYKYEDKEENVILIEKRLLVSSVVLPVEDAVDSPDQTAVSVASSLPSSVEYDNNTLRAELLRLGFRPGPIDNNNRTLYLKKLRTLQKNNSVKTTKQDKPTVKTTPQDKPTVKTTPQDKPTVKTTPQDKPTVKTKQQDKPTVKTTPQDKPTVKTTPQDKPTVKTTLQNPIVRQIQGKTFSIELEKSLISDDWMRDLSPYMDLENKARADFCNPSQKWREGTSKTSFTYLLLDPRVTANLPARAGKQSNHVSWVTFVNSIFYVGKGKRSRPYSHLYQALTLWKRDFTTSKDKKVQHILDIWTDKVGVVCLHIFQNVIPAEAYTYEAAMIDVIGVQNLKNLKCGNYYGAVQSWPLKDRRMLGLYLLYRAMLIFLSEGERQLRPQDIE